MDLTLSKLTQEKRETIQKPGFNLIRDKWICMTYQTFKYFYKSSTSQWKVSREDLVVAFLNY